MISYHPDPVDLKKTYWAKGFLTADVPLERVARGIASHVWSPIVWKDGHRRGDNFIASYFLALDFEDEDYPLSRAFDDFGDFIHIIGTTKSHQQWKDKKPPMDRFRVVIPWDRPITSAREHRYNMLEASRLYPCDPACKDAARYFFPCREVISVNTTGSVWGVVDTPDTFEAPLTPRQIFNLKRRNLLGILDPWVSHFLETGEHFGAGRNESIFVSACKLFEIGTPEAEVYNRIQASPFDRTDLSDKQILASIQSAKRRIQNEESSKK